MILLYDKYHNQVIQTGKAIISRIITEMHTSIIKPKSRNERERSLRKELVTI